MFVRLFACLWRRQGRRWCWLSSSSSLLPEARLRGAMQSASQLNQEPCTVVQRGWNTSIGMFTVRSALRREKPCSHPNLSFTMGRVSCRASLPRGSRISEAQKSDDKHSGKHFIQKRKSYHLGPPSGFRQNGPPDGNLVEPGKCM